MEDNNKTIFEALTGSINSTESSVPECHDDVAWWFDPDCKAGQAEYKYYYAMPS